MSKPLQALIQEIAGSPTEKDLRLHFMDKAGVLFSSQHWAISLHHNQEGLDTIDLKGLPDSFVDYYRETGIKIDPVMHYVMENHAPAHERLIFTEEDWKQSLLYREGCGIEYDHEHVMTGPIVGQGELIGTVHFSRKSGTSAFTTQDLAHLSALCAHLSARIAVIRTKPNLSISSITCQLTAREVQIAELVAKGLNNTEIGKELWITQNSVKQALKRMFRKLKVTTRMEMINQLYRG
jgi:DNA-binding CsgD family transcriptional regulator